MTPQLFFSFLPPAAVPSFASLCKRAGMSEREILECGNPQCVCVWNAALFGDACPECGYKKARVVKGYQSEGEDE